MNIQENKFKRFVVLLNKVSEAETPLELIKEHIQYLRKLDSTLKLEMCGPFTDYPGGMIILKCSTLEEAQRLASDDPFIRAGSRTAEVRTWELSCEENSHMGLGWKSIHDSLPKKSAPDEYPKVLTGPAPPSMKGCSDRDEEAISAL